MLLLALNEQAIAEINDSLGLGLNQYLAQKKVDMLTNPLDHLTWHNTALGNVITKLGTDYNTEITAINNLLPDAQKNTPWVRQMAADSARLKGLAELKRVDIQFPINKATYKAQKKKNKRDMEAKKDLIEEGS